MTVNIYREGRAERIWERMLKGVVRRSSIKKVKYEQGLQGGGRPVTRLSGARTFPGEETSLIQALRGVCTGVL